MVLIMIWREHSTQDTHVVVHFTGFCGWPLHYFDFRV